MKFIFGFLISFSLVLSSNAQQGTYFLQKHINSENGLPQNTVRDMQYDQNEFLWIATENGLVRYDGTSVKIYNSSNSQLIKNRITQLVPTYDGHFYCTTEGENLTEIKSIRNSIQLQFIKQLPYIGFSSYHLFKPESENQMIKIFNHVIDENYEQVKRHTVFTIPSKNRIIQISKQGLLVYNSNVELIKKVPLSIEKDMYFFVSNNELYCNTHASLFYHVNIETGEMKKCMLSNSMNEKSFHKTHSSIDPYLFWDYRTNRCFYIHDNSLFELFITRDTIQMKLIIESLPDFTVNSITYSPNKQSLIVGTLNNGIFIYQLNLFSTFLSDKTANTYYAQVYSNISHCVVASVNPIKINRDKSNLSILNTIINNNAFYIDDENNFWYSSGDLVFTYNLTTSQNQLRFEFGSEDGCGLGFIRKRDDTSLFISSNKYFYSYSNHAGLIKLGCYQFHTTDHRAYCLQQVNDSIYYIATDDGIFEFNSKLNSFDLKFLKGYNVRSLFKSRSGLVLAGTYDKGYFAIYNNKAIPIPIDKNENLKAAHTFIEDANGFLWISSNSGLFKIKWSEIENYVFHRTDHKILYYYRYSNQDGLITNEFNGGCDPSAVEMDSSIWSLPSIRGLVWFNPSTLNQTFNESPVIIDKIMLNDSISQATNASSINTKYHEFKLTIHVSSPNWSDDNNLYFEYAIDPSPSSTQWILLKDNHSPIIIQNLNGGNHRILIRKKNGPKETDYSTAEINIIVPKLWTEYVWFWPFVVCLILLTILGSVKLATFIIEAQKRYLERMVDQKTIELQKAVQVLEDQNIQIKKSEETLSKENELKNTLLFLLSHDIASPLRFINVFLSGAVNNQAIKNLSHEDIIDLTISTQNIESLLNNIVAWIKQTLNTSDETEIETIQLHTLLNNKLKLFQLAIRKKNNTILNEVPVELSLQSNEFIVSMALQNILGNAINYTKNGSIKIVYEESENAHQIKVIDSGSTSNRSDKIESDILVGYGIGLKITNELLKLIHGEIQLEPLKNQKGMMASIYIRKK